MKKENLVQLKDSVEICNTFSEEKDGICKRVEVRKVNNGYVISITENGYKGEKWINNEEMYISKVNPLETPDKSYKEVLKEALDNLKL